jgi:hypothetical protein
MPSLGSSSSLDSPVKSASVKNSGLNDSDNSGGDEDKDE